MSTPLKAQTSIINPTLSHYSDASRDSQRLSLSLSLDYTPTVQSSLPAPLQNNATCWPSHVCVCVHL